ncbi:MAG: DUF6345 domain-containing protein [Bacillota bacterium]
MKRLSLVMALTLMVQLPCLTAFAEDAYEASIWYIGTGSDSDALAAKTKLSSSPYSWTINHYKSSKNAGSEPSAYDLYNNSDYSDLVYISGHGYDDPNARLPLYKADGSFITWLYVDDNDAGSYPYIGAKWVTEPLTTTSRWNGDLEWAVIAACNQLNLNAETDPSAKEWARVMLGSPCRMHSIMGYTGLAPGDGVDTTITNEFFDYANANNGYTILNAWKTANNNHYANWAAIYHYANKNDHFHGQGTVYDDTDPSSDPDIRYLKVGGTEQTLYALTSLAQTGHRVLHSKHAIIDVKARIPEAPSELPPLLLQEPAVNPYEIARHFLGEDRFNRSKVTCQEDGRVWYQVDGSNLEIFPTGGISYHDGELEFTNVAFDQSAVVEKAKQFLVGKGQDVGELVVKSVRPLIETKLDLTGSGNDTSRVIAYQVEFQRVINGLALANGDVVRIILDNGGIKDYWNGLRSVRGTGQPEKLIPVEKAFEELEANLDRAFQMSDKAEISEISLVYYVSNMAKLQSVVHPAWAFKLQEGTYAYVDAFTGKILLDY